MGDAVPSGPSTSSPSEWHSIRPWTPHLTLAVREITSVSATFILSSSMDTRHLADDESNPELAGDTSRGIIADVISHELSVDVNGSSWQRVILRMNEHADEAIIVIYGLHPGRQYDIDLELVNGGTMRKQVTTEDAEIATPDGERDDEHLPVATLEPLSPSSSSSASNNNNNNNNVNDCSSPAPSSSTSQTPAPEERLRTLSHQLNALHAEQATLQAALKSSRRDANKTTTSLRAEIDVLKRASEKANIAEGKARQRVRALEDAVRRANEGRDQVEQQMAADEQELLVLREKQSEVEEVLRVVKEEADQVRAEREKREEDGRKRRESIKGECSALNQRLERLTVKKEKLENSVIPDLEAQLTEIQREIEVVQRDSLQNSDVWESIHGDPSRTETQRRRQSHPGTIGRPPALRTGPPPISPPHFPRHQPRSLSYRTKNDFGVSMLSHPPGLTHPSGPLHSSSASISHSESGSSRFAHSTVPALSHSTSTIMSQSPSSSLSRSTSSVGSSTLSSKAPPFEPSHKLRVSLSSSGTSSGFPSSGILSMSSSSFSPSSSSTFPTSGSGPAFPLSTTYPSTSAESALQLSNKIYETDPSNTQLRLGGSSTTTSSLRGPAGEDR